MSSASANDSFHHRRNMFWLSQMALPKVSTVSTSTLLSASRFHHHSNQPTDIEMFSNNINDNEQHEFLSVPYDDVRETDENDFCYQSQLASLPPRQMTVSYRDPTTSSLKKKKKKKEEKNRFRETICSQHELFTPRQKKMSKNYS